MRVPGRGRTLLVTVATVMALAPTAFLPARAAGSTFTDVAAGKDHSCAIRDGEVWCWGANDRGQLGAVTPDDVSTTPVHVHGLVDAVQLDAGANHTCAVLADSTVWCWGANNTGQLGDGTTTDRTFPVQVPISGVATMATGRSHSCALAPSGNDEVQQLTVDATGGTFTLKYAATSAVTIAWNATAIDVQTALETQVGVGNVVVRGGPGGPNGGTPFLILFQGSLAHTDVAKLATNSAALVGTVGAARITTVADGDTARVWCWGSNAFGQLGTADVVDQPIARQCDLQGATTFCAWAKIDADVTGDIWFTDGYYVVTHVDAAGRYLGANGGASQLSFEPQGIAAGADVVTGAPAAYVIDPGAHVVVEVTDHASSTLTGTLPFECRGPIGADSQGVLYLGCGTEVRSYQVDGGGNLVAGWTQSLAGLSIGTGTSVDVAVDEVQGSPTLVDVAVSSDSGPAVVTLSAATGNVIRTTTVGNVGSCDAATNAFGIGRTPGTGGFSVAGFASQHIVQSPPFTDYDVFTWSCLETRSSTGAYLQSIGDVPDDAMGGAPIYTDVAGMPDGDLLAYDGLHGDIVKMAPDGTLRPAWGRTLFASRPMPGLALEDSLDGAAINTLAAGGGSTCVTEGSAAEVWCWGDDGAGQLDAYSLPSGVDHTSVPVPAGSGPATPLFLANGDSLSIGLAHACGLGRASDAPTCWGESEAVPAPNLQTTFFNAGEDAKDVTSGAQFGCVRVGTATSGYARCWGSDDEGQRGDAGSTVGSRVQDAGGDLPGVVAIDAGPTHACAVARDGAEVDCWGSNGSNETANTPDASFDHAVPVLFPGDPGFPGVNVTLSGPAGAPTVGQWGPFVVTFDTPVAGIDGSDVEIAPQGAQDSPIAPHGDATCRDEAGLVVSCAAGPVLEVVLSPEAPLPSSGDFVAVVNRATTRTGTVGTGSFDLPETVTNSVAVDVSAPVSLVLDDGNGTPTVPLHGPLVVHFTDGANTPVAVSHVNETSITLSAEGTPAESVVPATVTECQDDQGAAVDCAFGPAASASLVPAHALDPSLTYVAHANGLRLAPDTTLLDGLGTPSGVAVDGQYLYWTDRNGGSIGRAWLDGTHANPHFIDDASDPSAIAVDANYLYWTNRTAGTIGRATLDASTVNQNFITGANDPMGVAVTADSIYWSNRASDAIGRAKLNGTSVNQAFVVKPAPASTLLADPVGVAADDTSVYWVNESTGTLGRADTDDAGSNAQLLSAADALGTPSGISLSGSHLFWADRSAGTIGRVDLAGPQLHPNFAQALGSVRGVVTAGNHLYWADPLAQVIGRSSDLGADQLRRSGSVVPVAVSNPVDVGPLADVTASLSADDGSSLTVLGDGPFLVTLSSADPGFTGVTDVDETNVVLVVEGGTERVGAAVLDCLNGTTSVDCTTGPVTAVLLGPDETQPPGRVLHAVVNPDYEEGLVLAGGTVVRRAATNTVQVEGPACNDPVCGSVSGPNGDPTVPTAGPFIVTFNQIVTNITVNNVILTTPGSTDPVPAQLVCRGVSGAVVDCASGAVVTVDVVPTRPLVPGQTYIVIVNPDGTPPDLLVIYQNGDVQKQEIGPIHTDGTLGEKDPAILYRWSGGRQKLAIGKRISIEDAKGASASFTFTGKRIQWFTAEGPRFGYASVKIDGALVDEVNSYAATTRYGVAHEYRHLSQSEHTITITVEGRKGSSKAVRAAVAVDAFKVLTPTGWRLSPNPTPAFTWGAGTFAAASDHTYVAAGYPGSATNLIFVGTSVRWHTLVGPRMGKAVVYLDGKRVRRLTLTAAAVATKTVTFGNLSDSLHRLRIEVNAVRKGPATLVPIDGFTVGGA